MISQKNVGRVRRTRRCQSNLDGILLVDKPAGMTSFRVVSQIKQHFNLKKVGHGGTLDPFATGLLAILIGKATKVSSMFLEHDKTYEGMLVLGKETDTYDVDGKVTNEKQVENVSEHSVKEVFKSFEGQIEQEPPAFSAIKIGGKKAYHLARQGKEVKLGKRIVNIYSLEFLKLQSNVGRVRRTRRSTNEIGVYFTTKVSKGTYIRSLARDIGRKLGTFAYLHTLKRTSSGNFSLKDAYSLEEVLKWSSDELQKAITNIPRPSGERLGEG